MITRFFKSLAILLAFTTTVAGSASTNPNSTIFDQLYDEEEVLDITLRTDLSSLLENRRTEEYQPAIISFKLSGKETITQQLKVKLRGKFRRQTCQFPPLMLNFSKSRLEESGFIPQYDKLKLVTHCIHDKFESKANVMKEYLAYKLYAKLTEQSYRVQLARVVYEDISGKLGRIKRYGFVIEDTDEMALRLGGEECEDCHNLSDDQLAVETENLMAVFQYMIGNTDWNVGMIRNVKLVQPPQQGPAIPVPYDFDFAGLVDAPYAIPNSDLGQLTIKQRIFQGRQVPAFVFENNLRHMFAKKEELIKMVEGFKALNWEARNEATQYLRSFFRELENTLEGKRTPSSSLNKAFVSIKNLEKQAESTSARRK